MLIYVYELMRECKCRKLWHEAYTLVQYECHQTVENLTYKKIQYLCLRKKIWLAGRTSHENWNDAQDHR